MPSVSGPAVSLVAPGRVAAVPAPDMVLPGATIGILGGGQLGQMLAIAARRLGYRVASLDPDPHAPAAGVSDAFVTAGYGDVEAALRMAGGCDVVTYELEHLDARVADAVLDRGHLLRPGVRPLRVTQDRLAERRFLEGLGIPVAGWREVASIEEARAAASALGFPLRLKRPRGGYDGRSQWRIGGPSELEAVWVDLGERGSMLLERELDFEMELSVVCTRGVDGRALTYPVVRNTHDAGILVESVAPAPVPDTLASEAAALATRIAEGLEVVGTLTAELFLLRDGSLAVNELAPRVHNSGHYTDDACVTSQFEQHVRAICGLPLGDPSMGRRHAAMLNVLGAGPRRAARLTGVEAALADPAVKLHLYDKREVFERRKMGHVTVVSDSAEDALLRARAAATHLGWAP